MIINRGLTEENTYLGIISPIGISHPELAIFYTIGYWGFFSLTQLYLALEIPNPQFGILYPTGELISPIGDNITDWGYYLLVL